MLRPYEDLSCGSCCLRIRREKWGKLKQVPVDLTRKANHDIIRDDDDNSDNDFDGGFDDGKEE